MVDARLAMLLKASASFSIELRTMHCEQPLFAVCAALKACLKCF
jgi:hypothetical protein